MIKIITEKLTFSDPSTQIIGYYDTPNGKTPIFHVSTTSDFNKIIGYAKHINASSGTVLYRGQNKNYKSVLPSGARPGNTAVADSTIQKMVGDDYIRRYFHLYEEEIQGWDLFGQLVIEAALQHYGANTYCMDFVDTHWVALWFGLYKFRNNHYYLRNDDENLYITMYLADTTGQNIHGLYIGDDTYTLDLRKVLPSTFQRPASQHGWVVRKKRRGESDKTYYDYNDRVIGIIEVSIHDAKKWLGNGTLLSEENFFPSPEIDQAYSVLLSRQDRSGILPKKNLELLLPCNTVCNYHTNLSFYYSDPAILSKAPTLHDRNNFTNITDIFERLLFTAWQNNTCQNIKECDPRNPSRCQSLATSILVKKYFGGEIYAFPYSSGSITIII